MYVYNALDQRIIDERVDEFRDQTRRFIGGELSDDAFRPLRLMNGLYFQTHAPMLRVAIPYGLLSSAQLRKLASIARKYDKGYGHLTTRQNVQFNWLQLEDVPDVLAELAEVQMHAIQTSGNCIRNITADPFAGAANDEIEDPRPYCELIRQWSTLHPEFSFLPRKFKIAVSGAATERAATQVHDIGIHLATNAHGVIGFRILVGGGLGRTPVIGKVIREYLPREHLLSYLEAILRIYNQFGRRDNKYKARVKILVNALGIDAFRELVEAEWQAIKHSSLKLSDADVERVRSFFQPFQYDEEHEDPVPTTSMRESSPAFSIWYERNTSPHKVPGYRIVTISAKAPGSAPGDITAEQMLGVANLAEQYSFGVARVTHAQNLVLADVANRNLAAVWRGLSTLNLATPNIGTLTDIICCPGLDYCSLANADSIPIARAIAAHFDNLDYLYDLGDINLKISGCMNACAHHHVGHIGILGVDKKGQQWYQITLGGSVEQVTSLGEIIGPAVPKDAVVTTIDTILTRYLALRAQGESFLEVVRRLGITPFKEAVYGG